VVGALATAALVSGSRSGSGVRVGPRLQPKPVAWSSLRHAPGSWPEEEDQIQILAGASHILGTTDVSLPLIEGRVLWTGPGGEEGFIQLLADDVNDVPTATRAFNLEQGMEEGMVEVHAPFSWKIPSPGPTTKSGSPVRVGPRLRSVPRKKGELGRIFYRTDQGSHRMMGLVAEPGRTPFWIWRKDDIDPSRQVYIAGWYSALAIRRVGSPEDHAESVRVFTDAIPSIVRDVYGPELWARSEMRRSSVLDAPDVRPITKVEPRGTYGTQRNLLFTQDLGIILGNIDTRPGPPITRTWPPIAPEVHHPDEWAKFREVDRRLEELGFRTA
jgi:hypothetical protein